jgi:hypothetical protein
MWLFTRYGFFSVACARTQEHVADPDLLMIRARRKEHLDNLKQRFPSLASAEIRESPNNDYRYRFIIAKSLWLQVVEALAAEQTWSNFKHEAASHLGRSESEYVNALHEVWSVMHGIQRRARS